MPENTVDIINVYVDNLRREYATGVAREHAYRPALKSLFESLEPGTIAINDPARQKLGAPDFQIENSTNHQLRQVKILSSPPLAFVEHKDITEDLDQPEHQSQLRRYLRLGNVLHTNGLIFRFYIKDEKLIEITLAELTSEKTIIVDSAQYHQLALAYHHLVGTTSLTVKTPLKLASLMAERAQAIRDIIEAALKSDLEEQKDTELTNQFKVFKSQLVHDLDEHKFADLYAQTLAYGLFAARYNDTSLSNFTLSEAARIMPPTNRFLRKFFHEIAGYERENRINWVLDNLVEVFNRVNVKQLMYGAGEEWAKHHDPIIHFYETFLGLYDAELRRSMGVYYTPQPIVNYIVRSVDEILKKDFGILNGLADDTKIEREFKSQPVTLTDKKRGYTIAKKYVHKVQVLDPALGTGTFLNEAIENIAGQVKPRLGSSWSKYVEQDLLPRLYGFELMMAPYAMANLRLNLTLAETSYKMINPNSRLHILLTNSLEAPNDNELNQLPLAGFQQILASEAQEADVIKANHNVMVVMGNPPYNNSSNNNNDFIRSLIKVYKENLNERKINLDDDYIKFIRFSEYLVESNQEGILAMITNNSFIKGVTHREMRRHLMQSFDKIYILDLHGDIRNGETDPEGNTEGNVFNIRQGVSIVLAVKTSISKELGEVYHSELYGSGKHKLEAIKKPTNWTKLTPIEPYLFFTPKDFSTLSEYDEGIKVTDLFLNHSAGIKTKVDHIATDFSKSELSKRVSTIIVDKLSLSQIDEIYGLSEKTTWEYEPGSINKFDESFIVPYDYRPFDKRYTYYDEGFLSRARTKVMNNFADRQNVGLEVSRNGDDVFIGEDVSDEHYISGNSFKFPLYLYYDDGTKVANFNTKAIKQFIRNLTAEPKPEEIFDYIYALLNTPKYRQKYKDSLKIDFPRIPAPTDDAEFTNYANTGRRLREIQLLKDPGLNDQRFMPTGEGTWSIQKVSFMETERGKGRVYINDNQFFANVPKAVWDFYIGSYQPAQKWLKARKGRELTHKEISHYQRIIAALQKTIELQEELDEIWKL